MVNQNNITLFIFLLILPTLAHSQTARESFYETLQRSCEMVAQKKGRCAPQNDLQKSILNTLQVSCETFRRTNGCEEFEQELLAKADAISNPRQKYSERAKAKQKIQGCTDDRICEQQTKPLSCFRGVLDGAVSNLIGLPILALTLIKMNNDILKTPAGELVEQIKKELGNRWNCYTPEARLELMCFLSASVIGSPGAIKAVSAAVKLKFPEIAALKSVQKTETEGAAAKAAPLATSVSLEEIKRNPQMAIWKLKQTDPAKAAQLEADVVRRLETSEVISNTSVSSGTTGLQLITLKDGTKAIWKPDDLGLEVPGDMGRLFQDMAKREQAAYIIDKNLDLNMVPVTTVRHLDGKKGSIQIFVNDLDKVKFQDDPVQLGFFDELISNPDRLGKNVHSLEGKPVNIDHGMAFFSNAKETRTFRNELELRLETLEKAASKSEQEIAKNSIKYLMPNRESVQKLKSVSTAEWKKELSPLLHSDDLKQFLRRREEILELVEKAEQKAGKNIYPDAPYSPLIRDK